MRVLARQTVAENVIPVGLPPLKDLMAFAFEHKVLHLHMRCLRPCPWGHRRDLKPARQPFRKNLFPAGLVSHQTFL